MSELGVGLLAGVVYGTLLGWLIARRGRISPARLGLVESVLVRIRERAERVVQGEDWDLAHYVVKTIAELE